MSIDNDAERAERRARNGATVRTMLAAFSAGDPEGQLVHCADDIVYEAPYYDHMVKRGKKRMRAMMGAITQRFDAVSYVPIAFISALDPDLVLCEVQGDHPVTGCAGRWCHRRGARARRPIGRCRRGARGDRRGRGA